MSNAQRNDRSKRRRVDGEESTPASLTFPPGHTNDGAAPGDLEALDALHMMQRSIPVSSSQALAAVANFGKIVFGFFRSCSTCALFI